MAIRDWVISVFFLCFACSPGLVAPAPRELPALMVIGCDNTGSVQRSLHDAVPDLLASALSTLRPGDHVAAVCLHRPDGRLRRDDPPEIDIVLSKRLSHARKQVVELHERLSSVPTVAGGYTDLGRVFYYLARSIAEDRSVGRERMYYALLVTDAVATGPQSPLPGDWQGPGDEEWRIVFLGVDPSAERRARDQAIEAGFANPERLFSTPRSHVGLAIDGIPRLLGKSVQPDLKLALDRARRSRLGGP